MTFSFEAVYTVRVYAMEIVVRPRTPVAACDLCQSVPIVGLDCTEDRNSCVSKKVKRVQTCVHEVWSTHILVDVVDVVNIHVWVPRILSVRSQM